jgi:glycerate kinase
MALLAPDQRDPTRTTTYGTGELLLAARDLGVKRIILGIGGSATVDGGIGCAQAAGLPVLMRDGQPVSPTEPLCGRDLPNVLMIKRGRGSPVERVQIIVACDVTNPLFGEEGAAAVFGPQKGASPQQVSWLDHELRALAERTGKLDEARVPGAGAAGGLGFGMMAYFGAALKPGVEIVIEAVGLRDRLRDAAWCVTGEGRLDAQSLSGKTAIGVSRVCRQLGVPCIAICGALEGDIDLSHAQGLTACFSICDRPMSLEDAMRDVDHLLRGAAANIFRIASTVNACSRAG